MLKVNELNDFSEFEDLKGDWNQILRKSRDSDVFSTWEWLWCWWKHFGKGRTLRILFAQEKDEIFAVAPLMRSKYNFLCLGKLNKLEFIGSPHSDYNNFIFLRKEKECLKLFLDYSMKFSDWDLLELRDIREGSVSVDALKDARASQALELKLRVGTLCPYINLPTSREVFMKSLSRNMRKNLRKRKRRLCEKYKVEVKDQHDFDSVEEAMEIFFELHQKRWISKGKSGAFASEDFRAFHRDVAEMFDEKGWLALYFLTVNDEPIAAAYSFDYNLKKYGYLTGFDPDFGSYGVGNLLKMYVVEECIRKNFNEYDLTRDLEPYKTDWATGARKNFVASLVYTGWFAKMYDWAVQNSLSQFLTSKLGGHLNIERSQPQTALA